MFLSTWASFAGKSQKGQINHFEQELHEARKEMSDIKGQLDANKHVLERKGEAHTSVLSETNIRLKAEADLLQKELTLKTEELTQTKAYLKAMKTLQEGIQAVDLNSKNVGLGVRG